jgi:outer membrane protein assembly factor BamD
MKKGIFSFIFLLSILYGCRTEFETIRTSADGNLIYSKAMEYYEQEEYVKAQTLFELAIPAYRGKAEAEDIYYKYAYTYYYTKEYILASHYFKNFSNTFYNSPKREEADFMVAYSNYQMSPSYKLDQTYSAKAIEGFQLFINSHPNSPRIEECNNLIDEIRAKTELKAFEQGKLYYHLRQYSSAFQSFENMLKDYPETQRAEEARYYICISSFLLAENSIFSKKEERYLDALKKAEEFLKRYKKSKYKSDVQDYLNNTKKELKKFNNDRYQG